MAKGSYVVTIVVDPKFGERLREIPYRMPVWIADTPVNGVVARALWAESSNRTYPAGVTTFAVEPSDSPAQWCAGILGQVDIHHGELSQDHHTRPSR